MFKLEGSAEVRRIKKRVLLALFIMFVGSVGLDQLSKIEAEKNLMAYSHETNLKHYQGKQHPLWAIGTPMPAKGEVAFYLSFNLNYVRNQGAAWGSFSNMPDKYRIPFFYGIIAIASIVILLYFRATPWHHRTARFALILVLSGAFGNFLDRVRIGYVIDWIDVRWNLFGWIYNFPNFNLADAAVSGGVILLLIDSLFLEKKRTQEKKTEASS